MRDNKQKFVDRVMSGLDARREQSEFDSREVARAVKPYASTEYIGYVCGKKNARYKHVVGYET